MKAVMIGLALILAACAGTTGSFGPQKSLVLSCKGYAGTLKTLAAFRTAGDLSTDEVQQVDATRPASNALCSGPVDSPRDALASLETAMFELIRIQNQHQTAARRYVVPEARAEAIRRDFVSPQLILALVQLGNLALDFVQVIQAAEWTDEDVRAQWAQVTVEVDRANAFWERAGP